MYKLKRETTKEKTFFFRKIQPPEVKEKKK